MINSIFIRYNKLIITILTVLVPLIFQLVYIKYVSYHIPKSDYGNIVMINTFILALSQIFLSMPMQAFNRFYNSSNKVEFINEFRTYLIAINIISLFCMYLYFLYYGDRFTILVYVLMYLFFLISNNYLLNQQIFLLNLDRKKYFILKLLEGFAKFIVPIGGYFIFHTIESFLGGLVVGYFISFVVISFFLKEYPFKITFNIHKQKEYFIYAYPVVFTALSSWSISFGDRFFIDYFINTKEVAIYAILSQFASFAQIISMIYTMYVTPIILKAYEENNFNGLKLLKKYLIYFIYLLVCLFIIFLLLPKELFVFFIEKEIIYSQYYFLTFIVLVLSIFLTVFQTAVSMYFVLLKKLKLHAKFFIFAAFINFVANFSIVKYGIFAAAMSTLVSYLILNILILWWVSKNKKSIFLKQKGLS